MKSLHEMAERYRLNAPRAIALLPVPLESNYGLSNGMIIALQFTIDRYLGYDLMS